MILRAPVCSQWACINARRYIHATHKLVSVSFTVAKVFLISSLKELAESLNLFSNTFWLIYAKAKPPARLGRTVAVGSTWVCSEGAPRHSLG